MKLKRMMCILLCALLMISCAGISAAEGSPAAKPEGEGAFSQWNAEAPALKALVDYVEAVTAPGSPDFIPESDRVATFDMDGTLLGELFPTYLEVVILTERILADPSWKPDEEMLEFGRMTRDHAPDKSFPEDYDYSFSHHQAKAFAGMTLKEYEEFVSRMLNRPADGFEGMTYGEAYYRPMAEVIEYLRANGFKCYIVSGADRFIVRAALNGIVDIPSENVIGSDTALAARNQGDTDGIEYVFTGEDELVRTDKLLIKDLKTNKVIQIAQEIGRQPVLSFGNSSGDVSMNNYALLNNPYRSAAFMVIADDNVREYGNPDKHDELTGKWQGMGYQVISMRDDWKTIYGENVKKTGAFSWLDTYADKNIPSRDGDIADKYTLEQVVVLSRHNLRAPLSSNGSVPNELTPHPWISWSAGSSELTLRGGIEETSMGQYFRKWLAKEGLFPENTVPEAEEIRFSARDKQRCRATARYFAAGMLPLADVEVEHPGDVKGTEDFMKPVLHFYSDEYAADATAQVAAMGGDAGFEGLAQQNRDAIRLIMDTVDMQDSETYQSGKYGDLLTDGFGYTMAEGKEPDITGAVKPANQVADALLLQYYEEPDSVKAAFGHELSEADWARLGAFMTTCLEMRHGAPLVAANIANPVLRELKSELMNEKRKFTFFCAHDVTVMGTMTALGVEDFALPESIETRAPIGVKLVFERRRDAAGQAWYRVSLIYRSTVQIRSGEMLTMENPPLRYDLRFEGVSTNEDGLISEADLFALFDRSIGVLEEMEAAYAADKAA
ncbi:MAG: haloacid dehalogenase-like hydrolase [Clostridia bacterium]|nr:haloacid dehalogenase-like hydrolase [Clostridia bacterium]